MNCKCHFCIKQAIIYCNICGRPCCISHIDKHPCDKSREKDNELRNKIRQIQKSDK